MDTPTRHDVTGETPFSLEQAIIAAGGVIRSAPEGAVAYKWRVFHKHCRRSRQVVGLKPKRTRNEQGVHGR